MRKEGIERRAKRRSSGMGPVIMAVAVAVLLGGCSSVPDAVNPVKWYENTANYIGGNKEKEKQAEADKTTPPGSNEPFPNLASVPAKPKVSSAEERQQIAQGLVGDNEGRHYASEVPRQGAPTHVLGSESTAAPASTGTPTPEPSQPPASAPPAAPKSMASSTAPAQPTQVAKSPESLTPSAPSPTPAAPPPPPKLTASAQSASPAAPPAPASAGATEVAPQLSWPVGSAHARMPAGPGTFETVVVSSSGVNEVANVPAAAAPKDRLLVPLRGVPEARDDQKGSIKVATIQFARGSAQLDARDRAILREVVALQRERGGVIRVVGHASSHTENMNVVHHKLVNYDISSARAETVAKALAKFGARAKDVVVVAKSDSDPLYYEFMPSGEAGNRRAEVYLDF